MVYNDIGFMEGQDGDGDEKNIVNEKVERLGNFT